MSPPISLASLRASLSSSSFTFIGLREKKVTRVLVLAWVAPSFSQAPTWAIVPTWMLSPGGVSFTQVQAPASMAVPAIAVIRNPSAIRVSCKASSPAIGPAQGNARSRVCAGMPITARMERPIARR